MRENDEMPTNESHDKTAGSRTGSTTFLQDLQFDFEPAEGGLRGSMTITPEMLAGTPGNEFETVSIGVVATVVDVLMGISSSSRADHTVSLTVDLVVRLLEPFGVGTYSTQSQITKPGRRFTVSEATIFDGVRPVAHSVATFIPVVLPDDVPFTGAPNHAIGKGGPLGSQFAQGLGIRHGVPGVATVGRNAYTLQPAGTIQGGVISTLAESAAVVLFGRPLTELDVRFLAPVRVGPGRAEATMLGSSAARVVVTDVGGETTRPTAFAVAR